MQIGPSLIRSKDSGSLSSTYNNPRSSCTQSAFFTDPPIGIFGTLQTRVQQADSNLRRINWEESRIGIFFSRTFYGKGAIDIHVARGKKRKLFCGLLTRTKLWVCLTSPPEGFFVTTLRGEKSSSSASVLACLIGTLQLVSALHGPQYISLKG